jgi:thymidylate synthase (FAD)
MTSQQFNYGFRDPLQRNNFMPKTTLINYTGYGADKPWRVAAELLVFTKNTRLSMTPGGMRALAALKDEELWKQLDYMAETIRSSWEFIDLTFLVENVSRAVAQQITRTRTGSYAMQSQRVTDMSDVTFTKRHSAGFQSFLFEDAMHEAIKNYTRAVNGGMPLEEARDLLPIGVHCNIVCKYNLRTLVDLYNARSSGRVQEDYRQIVYRMRDLTEAVYPWAAKFFVPKEEMAVNMLTQMANSMEKGETRNRLLKAIDLIK